MRTLLLLVLSLLSASAAEGRQRINFNSNWRFYLKDPVGEPFQKTFDDSKWEVVSVPHSHRLFSADASEYKDHGREHGWYRKTLQVSKTDAGKRHFLEFQGAMQTTKIWVNGVPAGEYAVSGFDSFHFDLTSHLTPGENVIALLVDNRPNAAIPPDGVTADYLLFGGLYRDVFLHITDSIHFTFPWEERAAGIRITYPSISAEKAVVEVESAVRNDSGAVRSVALRTTLGGPGGPQRSVEFASVEPGQTKVFKQRITVENPRLWSPSDPFLYSVDSTLQENGQTVDSKQTRAGLRWTRFDSQEGFFLNGKPLKLIGVNRHQSWPYIGFAVPNNLHRFDAEQIKSMGANWVRLSHYPHDPDFLDTLDELGLMALEEAPTWNETGDNHQWMGNVVNSFRSMIRRDRNHPSIIIWNACVNHHNSHPALVEVGKLEDPTRPLGQYNVPTPMNFTHRKVSGQGALTVEHTGHTYPAGRGQNQSSSEGRKFYSEAALAQRHWEHIDAVLGKKDHAGSAAWAMYDYNSYYNVDEPGMTWHGFVDLFRIPKASFYWHQSEFGTGKFLHLVPEGGELVLYSNAERIQISEDTGAGYVLSGEKRPPKQFTFSGEQIPFTLRHPPYRHALNSSVKNVKAESFWGTESIAKTWRKAGTPVRIQLSISKETLSPSDLGRVVATAIDEQGFTVDTFDREIAFTAPASVRLIGGKSIKARAGSAMLLVGIPSSRTSFEITASSGDIKSNPIHLKSSGVPQ